MATDHNQNHGLEFSMVMEEPDQELDWGKDTRQVDLGPWSCYHYPLVYQRWPKHPKPFKRTIFQHEPWYGNHSYAYRDEESYDEDDDRPYWNSYDARTEWEGEYEWPDPVGPEETEEDEYIDREDDLRHDQTDKYICNGLQECFTTSFLTLQGNHVPGFESILSHLAGEFVERTKPILAAGLVAQQTWTNKHQSTASTIGLAESFVAYAGHVGRALFGPDFVNPMLSTSTSTSALQMKMNPALAFPPGHGIIDRHSRPTYTPQIVVLHENKGPELEMHRAVEKFREDPSWDQVGFVVDVMDHPRKDMKTHSGLKFESAGVSIFRSLTCLTQNNIASGRTFGLSLCATSIRLWWCDAERFGTSRRYDFDDPSDARSIVDLIAFALIRGGKLSQRWTPPEQLVTKRSDDVLSTWNVRDWTLIEARADLFGSRTTVWSGMASPANMKSSSDAVESQPVILKSQWLIPERARHEHDVLCRLHNDNPAITGTTLLDEDTAKVIQSHLVRSLGTVHDANLDSWITIGASDTSRLQFTALLMSSSDPLPQALYHAEKSTFGMRGWIQIMRDIVRSLWFAASRGVHHRDMNGGNILYSTQPDGTIAGHLVDFGNARILDRPRLPAKYTKAKGCPEMHLLADDSRCANPTFQSLAAMQSDGAVQHYISDIEHLEYCRERGVRRAELPGNPDNELPKWEREMLEDAERRVPEAFDKAGKLIHRYIDDLESLSHLDYILNRKDWQREASKTRFEQWEKQKVRDGIEDSYSIWIITFSSNLLRGLLWKSYQIAGRARQQLDASTPSASGEMDPIEDQCFHDLVSALDEALPRAPIEGFVEEVAKPETSTVNATPDHVVEAGPAGVMPTAVPAPADP